MATFGIETKVCLGMSHYGGVYVKGTGSIELTDDEVDMMISNGHTCDAWVEHAGLYPSMHVGHEKDETGVVIPLSDLYRDYESFCRHKLSVEAVNSQQFGRDLHRLGFEWKRRAGGSHYKVYCDTRNRFVELGK